MGDALTLAVGERGSGVAGRVALDVDGGVPSTLAGALHDTNIAANSQRAIVRR
ncbi:MAG TPA: hypothetical protein VGS01_10320 [Candidatus Limnocylindria bacterium]|nr:hypothetical protein [Candidatus Limnocylindria bacterium]